VQQRLPSRLDPPVTFAHRGARSLAPENTIEAFELALRLGATGLETDAWLTSDRVVVLDHDGVMRRGMRRRPISEIARADLPSHIPSLEEMLDACGSNFQLSIDVKDPHAAPEIVRVVRSHDTALAARTWLCHPDVDRLIGWRQSLDDIRLLNSTRLERIREGPERRAATLAAAGIDGINMHRMDWSGGLVVLFHRFDLMAFTWDVQYEYQFGPAFRMGLDAVYSDDVEMMHSAFAAEFGV
jgi:glycerophosphoryl diester phosphodiesterase